MRKFLKRFPFNKVFVTLFVTLYTFLPSTQALGTVIEDYSSDDPVVMDISEDILEKGISDPEEIANPEVLEEEIPESTYEDGVYTVNNVELEEYVYPDDENVRVRFTSITEEGDLVISKVELTEEDKEELNTSDDYGWDITSTMSNGSFTYDLTLPNTLGDGVEVKYTEDGEIYTSIDDAVVDKDVIHIEGLEHFTIFVIVNPTPGPAGDDCTVMIAGTNRTGSCYPTIQQAINNAVNGDTIYVAAGEYPEYLSINQKAINIIGDGSNSTTIKPLVEGAVITINNSTTTTPMTIEGFTIDATNAKNGILIQNGASSVTIRSNKIVNFTDKGVLVSNGSSNFIDHNEIIGAAIGSSSGVYLDNQAGDNRIRNNTITLASSGSGLLYNIWFSGSNSRDNIVEKNTITGGLRAFQQDSGVSGTVTFKENNIGPSQWGVSINGGNAIITENFIKDSMRPIELGGTGEVTITNNKIDGTFYDFINVRDSFAGTINPIQHNSFLNMASADLHNRTGISIDATENYWGDLVPSDNISNSGGGSIDYSPWWGGDYSDSDHNTAWIWHTNDSVQDAIDTAKDEDIVKLENDFTITSQIDINKPLTLDGNNHKIFSNFTKTGNENNSTIGILGNNATIRNLTIDGSAGIKLHGINVYEAEKVLLDGVTLQNNYNAGLIVNGSDVTVNNITTAHNGWYGINVDQGSGVVSPSRLTITGISNHDESTAIAKDVAIYLEDITDWGTNVEVIPNTDYYYIDSGVSRFYLFDNIAPIVELKGVQNNEIYNTDISLSGTVTDANPHHYWLKISKDGVNLNIAGITGERSSTEFGITLTEDGEYHVTFAARDAVGGTSRSGNRSEDINISFTIDKSPPKPPVLIGDPVQYVKWGNVTRSWLPSDSTDVDYYMYKNITNGWISGPYDAGESEYNITHSTGNYDRVFEWQVLAVDNAGNETPSEESYRIVVDNTRPTVKITDVIITDKKLNFTVSGTDNLSGIRTVGANIYNENNTGSIIIPIGRLAHDIGAETLSASLNASEIDVSGLESGIYTIRAAIRDYAGNIEYATYQIEVDNTPPTIPTVALTANGLAILTNGYTNSETFTFNLSSADSVRYQLKYWNEIFGSSYKEGSPWNPTNLSAYSSTLGVYNDKFTQGGGKHYFAFSACDVAENCSPFSVPFVVTYDYTAPISTITTPSSGYITNEEPEIIGYTEDTYSVDKVVLSYTDYDTDTQQCGTEWTELTTITNNDKELLPFDWSYSEWNLEEGAYCIKAQGTDLAGNEENTAIIENVIYDTTPPQITLLDLVLGVLRDVDANDPLSGIAKIEVSTDNLTWQDYTSDLDLNDLVGNQPGTYTIYIRVTDKAGNTTTETVTFTIPSPTPTTTPTAGDILGVTSPLNPTPVQAFGTGGPVIAQTDEQDTEEEKTTEETDTVDDPEVKGDEDNEEQNGEEETTEGEQTKWWIYPLVILPILAIFLILWKRRKEDNEPQF